MERGWIFFPDGRHEEIATHLLQDETISWPPHFPVKEPGQGIHYMKLSNLYRRHEVIPNEAYVFLQDSTPNAEVPQDILMWVQAEAKKPRGVA